MNLNQLIVSNCFNHEKFCPDIAIRGSNHGFDAYDREFCDACIVSLTKLTSVISDMHMHSSTLDPAGRSPTPAFARCYLRQVLAHGPDGISAPVPFK